MVRILSLVGLAVAMAVAVTPVSAAEVKYALTGDNTKITFVGEKKGGKHDGGFKTVAGTATITDGDPTTLKIMVDIDMNSTYTDADKLTQHLKSGDFFEVKDNPKAKFVSTKVAKSGSGYTVTGNLTLRGKTKEVSFPAMIDATGAALNLTSNFTINRTDFGISYGKGMIYDDVKMSVKVKATK